MFNLFCHTNKLTLLILLISFFYGGLKVSASPDENQSLAILAKRCHYYHIRSRAGDISARYLLISKDSAPNSLTGLEKCINVMEKYLADPSITTREKEVYQQIKANFADLLPKLPKNFNNNHEQ